MKRTIVDLTASPKENTTSEHSNDPPQKRHQTSSNSTGIHPNRCIVLDKDASTSADCTGDIFDLLCHHPFPASVLHIGQAKQGNECTVRSTSTTTTITLCLVHLQQHDKWSCGYQNMKVQLAALLPMITANHSYYNTITYDPTVAQIPSIEQLQHYLEEYWNEGHDPDGAQHYRQRGGLYRQWIGAVEALATFTHAGIDATCVQFVICQTSRQLLLSFCRRYFERRFKGCPCCQCTSSDSVARDVLQATGAVSDRNDEMVPVPCSCPLFPLFLQWEGHSVSIVGYDTVKNCLLVLDSSKRSTTGCYWTEFPPVSGRDYQILLCSTRSLSLLEQEARQSQLSVLTAADEEVRRACSLV